MRNGDEILNVVSSTVMLSDDDFIIEWCVGVTVQSNKIAV